MNKKRSRLLALFLCLCMLLGAVPAVYAAEEKAPADSVSRDNALKGFRSKQFLLENEYRYADSDVVRAIVVLDSSPVAEVAGVRAIAGPAAQDAGVMAYRAKLEKEHADVHTVMADKRIDYKLVYEFDTLLNGFSCDVAYGDLDAIADIPGVDAVYIANTYTIPRDEKPDMDSSNEITGNANVVNSEKANGEGMVIAILDGGANVNHDAFQAHEDKFEYGPLTKDNISAAAAKGEYESEKIPFTYDYADLDTDVFDSPMTEGHGSHVAGIAAGYAEDYSGDVEFSGAAPGAQLVIMKIFSDYAATTSSDVYFAALEDALRLGVDVINMSIGTDSGFTHDSTLETVVFGDIYDRLTKAGIVVCVSAGNSGSMGNNGFQDISSKGYIGADYTDYGVVGSPSTYRSNISVASMENSRYDAYCIEVNSKKFEYYDSNTTAVNQWYSTFQGQTKDFVVITGKDGKMSLGDTDDYTGKDVKDKIAVVQRGTLDFQTKLDNAQTAGAIGLIVVNTESELIGMQITNYSIPAICVSKEAYEAFMGDGGDHTGYVRTSRDPETVDSLTSGRMSGFSSWGTTPDLTLKPTLTSVGGYVKSVDCGDGSYWGNSGYVTMSGTSMSSPNLAGTFANVLSWLRTDGQLDKETAAETAKVLLESTAGLVYDEYGCLYSVRKQGAGLGLADKAITAYESGCYISDPLKELGENSTGTFSFEVTIHNPTQGDVTYTPKAAVLTDLAEELGEDVYMNALRSRYLYNDFAGKDDTFINKDSALVTFDVKDGGSDVEEVTVEAGQEKTVTVTVTLTEAAIAELEDEGFVNGAFVEGYVQFTAEDTGIPNIHATFMGYYGDWDRAPALEQADFTDYEKAVSYLLLTDEGQQLLAAGVTPYSLCGVVTDFNLAAIATIVETENGPALSGITPGVNLLDYQDDGLENVVKFDEKRVCLSASENAYYNILYFAPFQLRNAEELNVTITPADREWPHYYEDSYRYMPKSIYAETSQGAMWNYYSEFMWDGTDSTNRGLPVADGTKVKVSVDVKLPHNGTSQDDAWSFELTMDSSAPKIESILYDSKTGDITVSASDNLYLAGAYLVDSETGELLDYIPYAGDEGDSTEFTFKSEDNWANRSNLVVAVMDYATNEYSEVFNLIDKDAVGKPVTVSLVTPGGRTTSDKAVGESFTFPACDESYNGCRFICWSDTKLTSYATLEEAQAAGAKLYSPGEELLLAKDEDATFYAVYEYGAVRRYDKTQYRLYDGSDYTGSFSINNPRWAMNGDLEAVEKAKIADIEWINPTYGATQAVVASCDFNTKDESIRFNIRLVDGRGQYTIQNQANGKYLAWNDDMTGLELADEESENTLWAITFESHKSGNTVRISPRSADSGKVISAEGGSWSTTAWTLTDTATTASDALPRMSIAADEGYEVDRYTTSVSTSTPTFPPAPELPGKMPTDNRPTEQCPSALYRDIPAEAWYHECVDYVLEHGLMDGVGEGVFDPSGITTRAQLVTILYRLEGKPAVTKDLPFEDVASGTWYTDAVNWAAANGIVTGYGNGKFGPKDVVTRQQLVTILYRYAGFKGYDLTGRRDLSGYSDAAQIGSWAMEAMSWAVAGGLVEGTGAATLSPGAQSTRAQVAAVLMRFCEKIVK